MRRLLVFTSLALSLSLGLLFAAAETPKKGPGVPRKSGEFVFNMVDGPQQLLTSYRGKTVVLALMFTTCPHCQKTAQLLTKVQTEYAPKGVQVLGAVFDQGAAGRAQQFSKSLGLNFPVGYWSRVRFSIFSVSPRASLTLCRSSSSSINTAWSAASTSVTRSS